MDFEFTDREPAYGFIRRKPVQFGYHGRGKAPAVPFERRYRGEDIKLLAEADRALGQMSGPATRVLMRRQYEVQQGDHDGKKGVYHVNLVNEVTQWQHVGTVEAISERFLVPILKGLDFQFIPRLLIQFGNSTLPPRQ